MIDRYFGRCDEMDYSEEQLTPWFPGSVLPARPGLYQVKQLSPLKLMNGWYEDGRWKLLDGVSVYPPIKLTNQMQWRGLNFEPKINKVPERRSLNMENGRLVDE